jgi:hypothetical protein
MGERMSEGLVVVRFDKEASQTLDVCVARNTTGAAQIPHGAERWFWNDSQAALLLQKKRETHIEQMALSIASDSSAPVSHTHIDGVFSFL